MILKIYPFILLLLLLSCSPSEPVSILGCLDSNACNFNASANESDDSCWYPCGESDINSDCSCTCDDGFGAAVDNCGICDLDSSNDCIQDCAGIWGGVTTQEYCDSCTSLNFDCVGICDGESVVDNCGTCDSDSTNDCVQDLLGIWGGDCIEGSDAYTTIQYMNQGYTYSCNDIFGLQQLINANANYLSVENANPDPPQGSNSIVLWDWNQNNTIDLLEFGDHQEWSDGRLISLKIESIPFILTEHIGYLTELKELILNANNFDIIPTEIGNLQKLETLQIKSNNIIEFPESLSGLANLKILNISKNNLSSLPDGIGYLENLQELDFSDNQLTNLPANIGSLSSLVTLNASNNSIENLPESFKNLYSLTELQLESNGLTQFIDCNQFTSLITLDLSYNNLTSSLASIDFGAMSKLEILDLSNNTLSHFPMNIGMLTKLENLNIEDNILYSLPEEIGNLNTLVILNANDNHIVNIPTTIDGLINLEQLQLARNELITFPSSLCDIFPLNLNSSEPGTGMFDIANNNICATDCEDVGTNASCTPSCYWESRNTYRIPFGDTGTRAWHDWQTQDCDACAPHQMQIEAYCADTSHYNILQRFIDINPNSLWGPKCAESPYNHCDPSDTNESTGYNPTCGLDFSGNNISCTSTSPSEWSSEEWWEEGRLVELNLNADQLHSHIPEELGNIETLRILRLEGNELSGEIPTSISNLSNLSRLDLSSNKLLGSIPGNIGSLSTIDTLSMANNNLGCYEYDYICDPYGDVQECCTIHCDDTEFCHGGIPTSLFNLNGVEHVDLQENNLSGTISDNIDNLVNLERLYLNDNRFSGSIPSSFGNMTNLVQLHLHYNLLSGLLSESLCNIYSNSDSEIITILYLQNNNLCPNQLPGNTPSHWPSCFDKESIGSRNLFGGDADAGLQWNSTQNVDACE